MSMLQVAILIMLSLQRPAPPCCMHGTRAAYIERDAPLLLLADSDPASGTLKGTLQTKDQALPGDLVVYLEPRDSSLKIPVPQQRPRVAQKGAQFAPSLTVICVGQSVEFVNDEDRPIEHNVFSNSPALPFDLGLFPQRESRIVSFDKPGAVVLHCSVHKYMDGVVFVAPNPLFSKVDAKGIYSISNVTPGAYTLKIWQRRPRFPEITHAVTIAPGQTQTVDVELKRK